MAEEEVAELRAEVAYWASVAAHGDDVAARLRKELKELRAECELPALRIRTVLAHNAARSRAHHTHGLHAQLSRCTSEQPKCFVLTLATAIHSSYCCS